MTLVLAHLDDFEVRSRRSQGRVRLMSAGEMYVAAVTPIASEFASDTKSAPLAIVTGGSRGLGYQVASGLIRAGHRVVLIAKDPERLMSVAKSLKCDFRSVDVADSAAFRYALADIVSKSGPVSTLVLAHGVMSEKLSKTIRTSDAEWRRVLSINLDAAFTAISAIAPGMVEARNGRIIAFSACLGRMSGPGSAGGLAPYRISKAGLNSLIRNFAHESGLGSRGVLVDATCPAHCRTDMGGPDAPRSAEEGAETAIWLATREFVPGVDQTGVLWEDRQIIPW